MKINELVKGNARFRKEDFLKLENRFGTLVRDGQNPTVLFISCCDSRVIPELILKSEPGDMFTLRNIGNFVPPYNNDEDFHSTSAAIEYAVSVLGVKDIIICGHSHCGACASLYQDLDDEPHLGHVKKWLELGSRAKEYTLRECPDKTTTQRKLRMTEKVSIKYQLENLLTYPQVNKKVKEKEIDIHGWYYKIEDGSIEYYDREIKDFKKLGK